MIRRKVCVRILSLFLLLVPNSVWAVPAFPGAEGFGSNAIGGRGGTVYEVTNLSDDSENPVLGSLRAAVEASGPRIVVFCVSGTIELQDRLVVDDPYITIAGQTAPGDGICLKNNLFQIKADHVIVRYMRFRPGRIWEGDAIWVARGRNIIIDHCSTSWASDETLSVATDANNLGNVTIQWCMITEGLNWDDHGYGSLVRGCYGNGYTFHHNLYAHHKGRCPRPGNYRDYNTDPDGLILDFRNNVIYNWRGSYAGYNADVDSITKMNFVGNYYKRGPNSSGNYAFEEECTYSRAYFSDNWMNGSCPYDPWILVRFDGFTSAEREAYKQSSPIPVAPMDTDDAETTYEWVLADVGASFPERDAVDVRIIDDVINGTGYIIDDEDEVGGWPELESNTPPIDSDDDGMPDDWEFAYCLDPCDSSDACDDRTGDGYTNIEEYINWLPLAEPMPTRANLNCDDMVNFYDLSMFAEHYPSSYGSPLYDRKYDFNNDGVISIGDLSYIIKDWLWETPE